MGVVEMIDRENIQNEWEVLYLFNDTWDFHRKKVCLERFPTLEAGLQKAEQLLREQFPNVIYEKRQFLSKDVTASPSAESQPDYGFVRFGHHTWEVSKADVLAAKYNFLRYK